MLSLMLAALLAAPLAAADDPEPAPAPAPTPVPAPAADPAPAPAPASAPAPAADPAPAPAPALDPAYLAAREDPSAAVLLLRQGSTTCAAVIVDGRGTIVTSYHCVADGGRAVAITRDGRRGSARVVSRLPAHDLAVLQAPELAGEPWLALREGPIGPGEAVIAWGHPLGATTPGGFLRGTLRWAASEGIVATVGPRAIQITAAVNPGNSGGPVLDAEGRIVGIVSRRLRGEGLGFASRAEVVRSLLDEPERGPLLGGSIRADVFGSSYEGEGGTIALGARIEMSARDRIVASVALARALTPTLDALRFDRARFVGTELTLGLRQRIGHGTLAARFDTYGGLALISTYERIGERAELRVGTDLRAAPVAGVRVGLANIAVDTAIVPDAPGGLAVRYALALRWPGRLGVW
jgi:S1-C subfamily serine protease